MYKLEELLQSWISKPPKQNVSMVLSSNDSLDILNILERSPIYPKMYWKGRNQKNIRIGLGMVEQWTEIPANIEDVIRNNIAVFNIEGFDTTQPHWEGYPSKFTFLPKISICIDESIQLHYDCRANIETKMDLPKLKNIPHCPTKSIWNEGIAYSHSLFENTELKKVVLARQSNLKCDQHWQLFAKLIQNQPNCYHFLYSSDQRTCFIGASPERLFQLSGNKLETEAIAGTRRNDPKETFDLQQNSKDQHEHQIVVDFIQSQLQTICTEITVVPQKILYLQHLQHLYTPISGVLQSNVNLYDVLKALHPTPAVCGYPQEFAKSIIHQIEDFNRGWYAGTMGCITNETIDYTVLIRSALCVDDQVFIWTGAGIVPDSIAENEWEELNNKATQFIKITTELQQ